MSDARASAWVCAWRAIDGAQQIRQKMAEELGKSGEVSQFYSNTYHQFISEARILALLAATSDMSVGVAAGELLDAQSKAAAEYRAEAETEALKKEESGSGDG
jgi:hypothetical protein